MQLRSLIVIALRLYAIYWLTRGIAESFPFIPVLFEYQKQIGGGLVTGEVALVSVVMIAIFVVLWSLAGWISTRVTRGHDVPLSISPLTKGDLYQFAFVVLGLYFLLSSLVSLIETGYHFFAFDFTLSDSDPQKGAELPRFSAQLALFLAGLASVLGAKRWTHKLLRHDKE